MRRWAGNPSPCAERSPCTNTISVRSSTFCPATAARSRRAGECKIIALLPYEGHTVQYKVQSLVESHQRIVAETDLRLPHTV